MTALLPDPTSAAIARPAALAVVAHSAPSRLGASALRLLAVVNVGYLALHGVEDIVLGTETAPPLLLALGLALFSGAPWLLAWLLERALAAAITIAPAQIVLVGRGVRREIPVAAVAAIAPWALPLPSAGLDLVMRSGRRVRLGVEGPRALLDALAVALPGEVASSARPAVAFAEARAARRGFSARYGLVKFGLYPLVLTAITFRLDQVISYGGPLGQYYLEGLGPYLASLARYAAASMSGLVLYAAAVRVAAEVLTFALTGALPGRARLLRRLAEGTCFVAYFLVLPAYLAALLLA